MKKPLLFLLLIASISLSVFGQKDKVNLDTAIAEKAADIFMEADKTLLEPNETAKLSIVPVLRNDPNGENPDGKPYSEFFGAIFTGNLK